MSLVGLHPSQPCFLSEICMRRELTTYLRLPMSRIETGATLSRRPALAGGLLLVLMLLTGLGWAVSLSSGLVS